MTVEGDLTFRELARKLADVIEAMALKLEGTAGLLKNERLLLAGKDYASLQSLLKELERSVSDFLGLEAERDRLARQLACVLGCDPKMSEIASNLEEEASKPLVDAADRLQRSMKGLKSEFEITSRLLDESKKLGDLVLSQLRGLTGSGFSVRG